MATEAGAFFQRRAFMTTPAPMAARPTTARAISKNGRIPATFGTVTGWLAGGLAFSGHWSLGMVLGGAKVYSVEASDVAILRLSSRAEYTTTPMRSLPFTK